MAKYAVVKLKEKVDKDFNKGDCCSCPYADWNSEIQEYSCMFSFFCSICPIEFVNEEE